jgi:hypothetical protein
MENNQKIYTDKAISIATVFGGPVAAGILIGHNYKVFGDDDKQRYSIIIGFIGTLIFFELLFLIPDRIMNSIPRELIPLIYTSIIYLIVLKTQGDKIKESIQSGIEKASNWKAAGIGLLCSIILIGYIFVRVYNMPAFDGKVMTFGTTKHEIYYNENIPKPEIEIVGNELIKFGYFKTSEKQIVQLTIEDDNYVLKIYIPKEWWENKDILESMESLRSNISNSLNRDNMKLKMLAGTIRGIEEKELKLEK